ncbi:HB2L protein, partial [Acrocephalus arundinaceus]|nr:HB2L protein [Acrocephalus arundinaceus]
PPDLCPAHSGVFQQMVKAECQFINGTEEVRFVGRRIYNREEFFNFDSDVGHFVGFTPFGEKEARKYNSNPDRLEYDRTAVDWFCRGWYKYVASFTLQH